MNKQSLMNMIRTAALAALAAIPGMCCSYSVSVPAIGSGGGVVPVYVNTQPGCAWQISHASNFLSYYGGTERIRIGSRLPVRDPGSRGRTAPVYVHSRIATSVGSAHETFNIAPAGAMHPAPRRFSIDVPVRRRLRCWSAFRSPAH